MNAKEIILDQLKRGQYMIEMYTADFSDAEYFKPPVPNGNHAGWIVGHLACTEDWAAGLATGSQKRLPQSVHDLFQPGSSCHAEASRYPPRKEIDELFRNSRAHLVEALNMSNESTWNQDSPDSAPKKLMPKIGSIWVVSGVHQFWHFGQLTVCRQALQKKKLMGL